MRILTNTFTIIFILVAASFLIYGLGFSQYKIYDKPDEDDQGKLSTSTTMTELQLIEEVCYDAITLDEKGNLINKGREAACLT